MLKNFKRVFAAFVAAVMIVSGTADHAFVLAENNTSNQNIQLTGTCTADGQVLSGHENFALNFASGTTAMDVNANAPAIDGYTYSNQAFTNGASISEIRLDESTGTELLQYTSTPSDETSWKELAANAVIEFQYTKNAAAEEQTPAQPVQSVTENAVVTIADDIANTGYLNASVTGLPEGVTVTGYHWTADNSEITARAFNGFTIDPDAQNIFVAYDGSQKAYAVTAALSD